MSENNNGGINIGDELNKVFKMGVGAVSSAVEKGKSFVEDLTTEGSDLNKRASELGDQLKAKGEAVIEKVKAYGAEAEEKVEDAVGDVSGSIEGLLGKFESFSDEHLKSIIDKAQGLLDSRKQQGE